MSEIDHRDLCTEMTVGTMDVASEEQLVGKLGKAIAVAEFALWQYRGVPVIPSLMSAHGTDVEMPETGLSDLYTKIGHVGSEVGPDLCEGSARGRVVWHKVREREGRKDSSGRESL